MFEFPSGLIKYLSVCLSRIVHEVKETLADVGYNENIMVISYWSTSWQTAAAAVAVINNVLIDPAVKSN